ncbi:MAG: EAL domain-containing protein [Alphaproteobacteria bacterium]|nr:hypothetical protein [Alphaproteobacteria bacterium]TAD87784.1 MAG: EAL domain-containing protein [Alphaproteobacteria bacterium]
MQTKRGTPISLEALATPQVSAARPPFAHLDTQVLDHLDFLSRNRSGKQALVLHLGLLSPQNRREQIQRVAYLAFKETVRTLDGQAYQMSTGDILWTGKVPSPAALEPSIARMRLLFAEDPLIQSDAGQATSRFATWYLLESQFNDLLGAVKRIAVAAEDQRRQQEARAQTEGRSGARQPMDPTTLAKLEALLARTDLSNLMRRQAIVSVTSGLAPTPLIRELTISINDLQTSVVPDIDLFGDQWLFQRLTQTLDRRMLAALARAEDGTLAQQVSLNLNVSTILSPEFLAYDQTVKNQDRSSVVIEMQKIDIFADPGAFLFARDFLKERGYKVALDGLTFMVLPFVDREKLGLDLLKVQFSPEMLVDKPGQGIERMKEYVERCGRARMILYRVEDEAALTLGKSLGISLFQGHYLDKLIGRR